MKVEDDFKEIQDLETETEEESPKRKWPFVLVTILMCIMLLTWIFMQYPLSTVIAGQLRSGSVKGTTLETLGYAIQFEQKTLDTITTAWYANLNQETTLCLHGKQVNTTYYLSYAYQPEIFEQSFKHVRHAPCDNETIMMFHTHPYKSCLASSTDLNTLKNAQERDEDILMMIMCEGNRYTVYH